MCQNFRALLIFNVTLLVVLVTPSAFAQSIGKLAASPTGIAFGGIAVGSSSAIMTTTLTNTGNAPVTFKSDAISAYFSWGGIGTCNDPGGTLAPGASCTFSAKFTPTAAGTVNGYMTITSNASNPTLTVPLSGTGTVTGGTLSASPTGIAFGGIAVGSSSAVMTTTLTNTGNAPVTFNSDAISANFSWGGIGTCNDRGGTLAPGASCTFSAKFTPTAAGTMNGYMTIASNALNPTLTVPLSGTGTVTGGKLSASATGIAFGSIAVGSSSAVMTTTLTNTGNAPVTFNSDAISANFSWGGIGTCNDPGGTLAPGASCTLSARFTPTAAGTMTGNMTIVSNALNPTLTVPLSGTGTVTGGTLSASPTGIAFGGIAMGSSSAIMTTTLTNTGNAPVRFNSDAISANFSWGGIGTCNDPGGTLAPGASCTFSAKFTPTAAGTMNGYITIASNALNPTLTVPLSGTGTVTGGTLSASPTNLALGSVVVGTSGTASGSLTASGGSVTVTAASSSKSVFSISGLSLPATIPAGQSAPFTVTFSPQTTGAASATLTFTSSALTSNTTEAVTGTGAAAQSHTVNLSWDASTSPNISGYNIYRAVYANSSCGSFSKVNLSLNVSTVYTDSEVLDGTSYCYATTAVNSSDHESSYSNIASNVRVPAL